MPAALPPLAAASIVLREPTAPAPPFHRLTASPTRVLPSQLASPTRVLPLLLVESAPRTTVAPPLGPLRPPLQDNSPAGTTPAPRPHRTWRTVPTARPQPVSSTSLKPTARGARTPTAGFPPLPGQLSFALALAVAANAPATPTCVGTTVAPRPHWNARTAQTARPKLASAVAATAPTTPPSEWSLPRAIPRQPTRATAPPCLHPTSPRHCGSSVHPP